MLKNEAPFVIVNINDNDMNLLLIESYLTNIDAVFMNFTDSLKALDYLQNNPVDMVIVDYRMPKMDGITLAKKIKKIDSEIPVLMITENSAENTIHVAALKEGVDDFITKPITKSILLNRVQNFMKLRKAMIRLSRQEKLLQKQIEKATTDLQKNIMDLQIAQKITNLGSWKWNILTGEFECSDETYRIFGLEPQSIQPTYETFLGYLHAEDTLKVQQAIDYSIYNKTFYDLRYRIVISGEIKYVHGRGSVYYNDKDEPLYMVGTIYNITETTEAYQELEKKEHEILQLLSRTAEYKNEERSNHVKRISNYAVYIAKQLNLSKNEQEILRFAAPLHDIGKVGTPDHILLKPGQLNEAEMKIIRDHTTLGGEILEDYRSTYLQAGHVIALSHHEKFDGSGYPFGLKGNDIPLYGRIVAIADVFDALTSNRPYKTAWSFEAAMDFMKSNAGNHFDPELIELFTRNVDEVYAIYSEYED